MSQWRPITVCAVLAALIGLAVWGLSGLTRHAICAIDRWGDAAPNLKPTLDAISGPRGTLHEVNKAVVKIGDAIVTTQLQERRITPVTVETVKNLGAAAGKLGDAADALKETADAGADSARALTATLGEGQRTIAAAQPLLASYTAAGDSLNELLKRKAIGEILDHAAGITENADGIIADGRQVADKATADYLRPVKWYMQPLKKSGQIIDIGAAIARHTP